MTYLGKYRKLKSLVKRESKISKTRTWHNFLNSMDPMLDIKTLWSRIKGIRTERRCRFPTLIDDNVISNPIDSANKFVQLRLMKNMMIISYQGKGCTA